MNQLGRHWIHPPTHPRWLNPNRKRLIATDWQDLGPITGFERAPITPAAIGRVKLAVTHKNGEFGVVNGVCNHAGGPLGSGRLEGDYIKCP